MKKLLSIIVLSTLVWSYYSFTNKTQTEKNHTQKLEFDTFPINALQNLGKQLFLDNQLSNPAGTSCASCHAPNNGFSDARLTSTSVGSVGKFVLRNAPTLAYAAYSPFRYYDKNEDHFVGGYFWDGRVATLEEQISGPLFNHNEMNISSKTELLQKIQQSSYANLFVYLFGANALNDTIKGFNAVLKAISSYEQSAEMSPFNAKFDWVMRGKATFTTQEALGFSLFNDVKKGNCAACHPSTADPMTNKILFTDFTYDNIGLPAKEGQEMDLGLANTTNRKLDIGKFKVPSLRNIAVSAPYFHNGSFTDLTEAIQFYNHRDSGKFGKPQVSENVNTEELGRLNLSDSEVAAIEAFLLTLTDGYKPE